MTTVLVLGTGVSGVAAARAALRRGMDVKMFDERPDAVLPSDLSNVPLGTGEWDATSLADVDRVVTSPGFAPVSPPLVSAAHAGVPVITEAGFGLEGTTSKLVAVTGTNGKSTVVSETARMLDSSGVSAIAAGNIGAPLSDIEDWPEVVVAELSSFQLTYMRVQPAAATILNIAPDHLDWHASMEEYIEAKASIGARQDPDDLFAANADDERLMDIARHLPARTVECSGSRLPAGGNGVDDGFIVLGDERVEAPAVDASYMFDLVVAATLAGHVGATMDGIASSLASFEFGEHRRSEVGNIAGVRWVNDSKATNPHATVAAASGMSSVRLLAGGRNKGLDLSAIGGVDSVVHVYAFGEAADEIARSATRPVSVHPTMADAVEAARRDAKTGDTVLLSPGCTSFDEFTSYAERGERFEALVEALSRGAVR